MLPRPDARPYVTPELATALDGCGHFVLPPPAFFGAIPVIAPERAREIARASLPFYLPVWNSVLAQRGLPQIDARRLALWPDAWYADTPHQPLAPAHVREQVYAGPWYVLHAGVDGEPRGSIEVSALASDVALENGAFVDRAMALRYVHASPARLDGRVFVSPEQAVAHLCTTTDAKVTEIPVLLRRSGGWAAAASLWRLALDRSIEVVTTHTIGNTSPGRRSHERAIFVGPGLALYVPAPDQGPIARMCSLSGGGPYIELPLRPGMAQRYDEVELVG